LIHIGTNLTVYGILLSPDGSLSLSYTIDGGNATTVSHNIVDNTRDALNFPMVHTGPLAAGNHTIVVTLTEIITSQKFIVDYITYTPSFQNLAAMPHLSNVLPSNKSSPSTSYSSLSINSTSTSSNTSSPSASDSSLSHNSSASSHIDAIAGGIGGFACLTIIVFAVFFFIHRRRPPQTKGNRIDPYPSQ
jgi:hypothetical protein